MSFSNPSDYKFSVHVFFRTFGEGNGTCIQHRALSVRLQCYSMSGIGRGGGGGGDGRSEVSCERITAGYGVHRDSYPVDAVGSLPGGKNPSFTFA